MTPRRVVWMVLALLGLVACAGLLTEAFLRVQDAARKASCRPEYTWREVSGYATGHEGLFPPLEATLGRFIYDTQVLEPLYPVKERVCEYDHGAAEWALRGIWERHVIDDWSYVYLGYCLENEEQGLAFLDAYRKTLEGGGNLEQDLKVPAGKGNCGGDTLFRLRDVSVLSPEAACLRTKAAHIPVVIEWPGNHRKLGGKVVFLDGTVRYVLYPGPFPMTRRFIEGLRALDAASPPPRGPQ